MMGREEEEEEDEEEEGYWTHGRHFSVKNGIETVGLSQ